MTSVAAFPGSYNPPTVAHLAMAEATVRQCGVGRVDLVLSRSTLGKEAVVRPSIGQRADVLRTVAENGRPWLGVVVTDHQLLADIAEGYDVLVLGADKWEQVMDPVFYGGSVAQRDAAVARLPHLAVARRLGLTVPTRATVLDIAHDDVSSTAARSGQRDLMLPEAVASGLW